MNADDEIRKLLRNNADLVAQVDLRLDPYTLEMPPIPPGLYWKLRWIVGWILRALERLHLKPGDPWPVRLRHVVGPSMPKAVTIWAIGIERDRLQSACKHFANALRPHPEFAPVLITDVADFAFFSKLGWLVEYVPSIEGQGESYTESKARYLAKLYAGNRSLPAIVAVDIESAEQSVQNWVLVDD